MTIVAKACTALAERLESPGEGRAVTAATASAHNTRNVLVVDDDPLVLRSMYRALTRNGYHVLTAESVHEALALAADVRIDAAIVDYALSRESGMVVLSRLRQLQPHCVRVLCTGRTELPVFVEAVNAGEVAKVIRKPFPMASMLSQLEEALASAAQMERYTTEQHQAVSHAERQHLEQAIQPGMIGMALQPIVRVDADGRATPCFYEALLRPRHHELATPLVLLTAAERHERVEEVASVVLAEALAAVDRVPSDRGLFVNLHPHQLGQPEVLAARLAPFADVSDRITLEITERSRLQDIARWDDSIRIVTGMGFGIAVDDLGAGYSSLSILADLRPQFIKLDMSLVRGIHESPRKQRLVELMATFGAATESAVIAEGVEEQQEADVLLDMGVPFLQGYLFGRPSEEDPDGGI